MKNISILEMCTRLAVLSLIKASTKKWKKNHKHFTSASINDFCRYFFIRWKLKNFLFIVMITKLQIPGGTDFDTVLQLCSTSD